MSDWSKVTRPIPVPNEWTQPFWQAAKQGVLALQRCQACRRFQHPPYPTCVNCMAIDLAFERAQVVDRHVAVEIAHGSLGGAESRRRVGGRPSRDEEPQVTPHGGSHHTERQAQAHRRVDRVIHASMMRGGACRRLTRRGYR